MSTAKTKLLELMGGPGSYEEIAQEVVAVCAQTVEAQICTLWRVYDDQDGAQKLKLLASYGVAAPKVLAQEVSYRVTHGSEHYDGITGYVASALKEIRVDSYEQLLEEYRFAHQGKMDGIQWQHEPAARMRNLLALPLHLGKQAVGVLKVENRQGSGTFTDTDVAILRDLAEPIAVFCKGVLLMDHHERRLIDAPTQFSDALLRPFDPDQLTQEIVTAVAKNLNAQLCSLWLLDGTGRHLIHKANYGVAGEPGQIPRYTLPSNPDVRDEAIKGITAWVAVHRRPFWANSHEELRKHPSWRGDWDNTMWGGKEKAKQSFRSMYAVPLLWNNELLGVLKVENPQNAAHFTPTDHLKCRLLANYVGLLLVITRELRMQLAPDLAHVLKSPAAQVSFNLAALADELGDAQPDLQALRHYVVLARRAAATIDVMSRTLSAEVTHRVSQQKRRKVKISMLLNRCVKHMRTLAPQGLRFSRHFEPPIPTLLLSQSEITWLEIVIFNLLHNAIKFSPRKGRIGITIEQSREPGKTIVAIEDQGSGISQADRQHVFDAGFKRQARGWPEGTGLGLFTVKRLLDRLDCVCEITSARLGGARFEIHIPKDWRRADERQ